MAYSSGPYSALLLPLPFKVEKQQILLVSISLILQYRYTEVTSKTAGEGRKFSVFVNVLPFPNKRKCRQNINKSIVMCQAKKTFIGRGRVGEWKSEFLRNLFTQQLE